MKTVSVMLKPASSLCNLRCRYCFYADVAEHRQQASLGIMQEETADAILDRIALDISPGDRIQFIFQGGEPTLAGLPFFRHFVEKVAHWDPGIAVSYALQTNGILLDEDWCRFLKEHDFLVGVSLDILPECHDAVRVDTGGRGTYGRVLESIRLLDRHAVAYNVLCTLTNTLARHPQQVWKRLCQLDIAYVQFTPCLGELEGKSPYALTPKRFASFYIQLFLLWLADYRKGKYRSVKLFDDVVNLLVLGRPTACGMNGHCQPQLVVEADGSVYPCDFYCLDQYRLGNLWEQGILAMLQGEAVQRFLQRPHTAPSLCSSCRYRSYCGGNCKRMQKEICCAEEDTECGYREFLDQCGPALAEIARQSTQGRK